MRTIPLKQSIWRLTCRTIRRFCLLRCNDLIPAGLIMLVHSSDKRPSVSQKQSLPQSGFDLQGRNTTIAVAFRPTDRSHDPASLFRVMAQRSEDRKKRR
jgi:hypothetical protein